MIDSVSGTQCPACGSRLVPEGDGWYECSACDEVFEILDLYLP